MDRADKLFMNMQEIFPFIFQMNQMNGLPEAAEAAPTLQIASTAVPFGPAVAVRLRQTANTLHTPAPAAAGWLAERGELV